MRPRKSRRLALIAVMALGLVPAALAPALTSANNIGNEGCTPGYWKNHTDNWEEYSPTQTVSSAFGSGLTIAAQFENQTLLEALQGGGGTGVSGATKILLRAGTAAILNAAHEGLGYPVRRYAPDNMIQDIVDALNSGDRDAMLALAAELDRMNNLGCPLN